MRIPFPRRVFFVSIGSLFASVVFSSLLSASIDRKALVERHNPHIQQVDPEAAVSLGNGEFAMTVDVTGLQSLSELYYEKGLPLETLSTWAWHSFPNEDQLSLEDASKTYPFYGREIEFAALQHSPAGAFFRANPHPIALGKIGFLLDGRLIQPEDLSEIDQTLDLWTGVATSQYELDGAAVEVTTAVGSSKSTLACSVTSKLIDEGRLKVTFWFPLSYKVDRKNKPHMIWDQPRAHSTVLEPSRGSNEWILKRDTLGAEYYVGLNASDGGQFEEVIPHVWSLSAEGADALSFAVEFSPEVPGQLCESSDVVQDCVEGWNDYWTDGGMVQLNQSTDPRAIELERRIVLSQYLLRVNYSGGFPPSEAGLQHITWFGKHHSEMYFWHCAHWYIWGRTQLLENSLKWYQKVLPSGLEIAKEQGFEGVRWPKMSGINGRPSPGSINPFIIWNQPNPIYLCELVYRSRPGSEVLEEYKDMVFASADFLASYAQKDAETGKYNLGPPIKAVTENTSENHTKNPTYELAYWYFALNVAQQWRERLGMDRSEIWQEVLENLTPLPMADGKYLEIESFKDIYTDGKADPYSMVMALGFVPETKMVNGDVMKKTFAAVTESSDLKLERWNSWSMSAAALCCTRLEDPETALDVLAQENEKVHFMPTGYIRRAKEPEGVVAYLPVNSSFLNAIGMMAGGWDGAPERIAPGFPDDGSWVVEVEDMNVMP